MFVKTEHYTSRKEEVLNDEGQMVSTKLKWDCKHCGWISRDNATDLKRHVTKCPKTNSKLKESMEIELRDPTRSEFDHLLGKMRLKRWLLLLI